MECLPGRNDRDSEEVSLRLLGCSRRVLRPAAAIDLRNQHDFAGHASTLEIREGAGRVGERVRDGLDRMEAAVLRPS